MDLAVNTLHIDKEVERTLMLNSLAVATAITRTPFTKENIQEARCAIDRIEKELNSYFDGLVNKNIGSQKPISPKG